jgi:transcriptional regulator with XRE-family HTH domain
MTQLDISGARPGFTQGDHLRKAREYAGLEQGDLATELGVSRATISNYERGLVKPRKPVLVAWALRTGVALDWLCPRQDSNLQPTGLQEVRWALAA